MEGKQDASKDAAVRGAYAAGRNEREEGGAWGPPRQAVRPAGGRRRKVVQLRLLNMEQVILGLSDDMKTSLRKWC